MPQPQSQSPRPAIPVSHVDVNKRYDVYCMLSGEERVYENVVFVGIRTFDAMYEFTGHIAGGYLEIEAPDGTRMLIPQYGIQLICDHGAQPAHRVVRRWGNPWEY
jgi:hypothetical protein